MKLFEITDKSGRLVYLTRERWKHIAAEHPAVAQKLDDIQDTLLRPFALREARHDAHVQLYYRYYKQVQGGKYLVVVVKYLNGQGFVLTSFYSDRIKEK